MRQAIVSVRDEDAALGVDALLGVFEAAGLVTLDVLSCEGSRGVVRVGVEEPVDEQDLEELPTVAWYERVESSGPDVAYLVGFDIRNVEDAVGVCGEDRLLCGAVDVGDDGVTVGLAGSQGAISDAVTAFESAGASVGLEALRDFEPAEGPLDALTSRQRDVLEAAYDLGYFDVPRSASTADVAAELDLDPSTVTEHLQRAERNLLGAVLDGLA